MRRKWMILLAATVAILAGPVVADAAGADWPQFRGTHRDGVSVETGLLDTWPEAGPKQVWRRDLGDGFSAISVVGGRLYTMYAADQEGEATEFAAAFDAATGEEFWRVPMGARYDNEFGHGPRATPSVDGEIVYVMDSYGSVAALATEDGSERWKLSLTETFGSSQPYFGFSASILVDGKQVLVQGGGAEGKSYAALNKKNGKVLWTAAEGPPQYNSPLPVEVNGQRCYVYVLDQKVGCLDAKGNELWSHEWPRGETHAVPLFVPPNRIFASGAEGVGGRLLEIQGTGKDTMIEEVWTTRFMRNHFSSSVLHDGHLYGFDNATLKCINAKDGELAWAKRGLGKGSLMVADGKLIVLSDQGKLLLVEATPSAYEEKGSIQALEGKCWTAPVLSGGKLYLRNHTEMVAYDVKG